VLAVIFATIAIPFALDNRWTTGVLGGQAGVYWTASSGSRQLGPSRW
jgi:hypothetical protein